MMKLAIDTTTDVLGVAIEKDGVIVAEIITHVKQDHSSRLMPAVVRLMNDVAVTPEQLDAIVVAHGPGSYTGTRIGITTAKTMAWALDIPIYSVSSLQYLAFNGQLFNGFICPFFDARRKTVFTALYRFENGEISEVLPETNCLMEDWLEQIGGLGEPVLFLSPHYHVFENLINEKLGKHAIVPSNRLHLPQAAHLFAISEFIEPTHAHLVKPNYLRITEAEANLLKSKGKDD